MASIIRTLVHGDLYKNWETLLRITRVTEADEGKDEKKKQIYKINSIISLWLTFCGLRLLVFGFFKSGQAFMWGASLAHTGNARHLLGATAALYALEAVLYRLGLMRLVHVDGWYILRSLRSIATCPPDVRQMKELQARVILVAAVVGMMGFLMSGSFLALGVFAVNVYFAKSGFEVACWCFYGSCDVLFVASLSVDLIIFPCIWILVAFNYWTDLSFLVERIDDMKNQSNAIASTAIFREVYLTYFRLKAKADLTNRMSAPILWSLTFCTTPVVCLVAFITVFSDNAMFRMGLPVVGVVVGLFACSLLLMAAKITSLTDKVYEGLCCTSARNGNKWTLKHKVMLLNLVQDAGSPHSPLAMYTTSGDKYTSESLLHYTLETILNYLMLVTLKNSILT